MEETQARNRAAQKCAIKAKVWDEYIRKDEEDHIIERRIRQRAEERDAMREVCE